MLFTNFQIDFLIFVEPFFKYFFYELRKISFLLINHVLVIERQLINVNKWHDRPWKAFPWGPETEKGQSIKTFKKNIRKNVKKILTILTKCEKIIKS